MGLFTLFSKPQAKSTGTSKGVSVAFFKSGRRSGARVSYHSRRPCGRMLSAIRHRLQLARGNQKAQAAKLERCEKSIRANRADS